MTAPVGLRIGWEFLTLVLLRCCVRTFFVDSRGWSAGLKERGAPCQDGVGEQEDHGRWRECVLETMVGRRRRAVVERSNSRLGLPRPRIKTMRPDADPTNHPRQPLHLNLL